MCTVSVERIEARVEEGLRGHSFFQDLSSGSFWSQDPFTHLEIIEEHESLCLCGLPLLKYDILKIKTF